MGALNGGMSKRDHLDLEVRTALAEGSRFDLIAMGRSEGPGCYCAVNHNLREVIDAISKNYRFVVIDNEAGMEHLSRRTTRDVQHLLVISDVGQRGRPWPSASPVSATSSISTSNIRIWCSIVWPDLCPRWRKRVSMPWIFPYGHCAQRSGLGC